MVNCFPAPWHKVGRKTMSRQTCLFPAALTRPHWHDFVYSGEDWFAYYGVSLQLGKAAFSLNRRCSVSTFRQASLKNRTNSHTSK